MIFFHFGVEIFNLFEFVGIDEVFVEVVFVIISSESGNFRLDYFFSVEEDSIDNAKGDDKTSNHND